MSWVTLSLRKMTLKQRSSNLEFRLTQLSQQKQTIANQAAYAQRTINSQKNLYTSIYNMVGMASLQGAIAASQGDQANMMFGMYQHQQGMMMGSMIMNSVFDSYKNAMDEQIRQMAAQIDEEITQVEAQLKAAKAEEESISKAMDDDIKKSAIQLV